MLNIHATKKLFAKLPLDDQGCLITKGSDNEEQQPPVTENPLAGWHANVVTLQQRNCVIWVHDATRFPLVMTCLVKADFANLDGHFADTLMNTLLKVGANQEQLDTAASLIRPCQFDTRCDRSVQGTMNRMKGEIEHLLWFDNTKVEDISGYKTGAWLAERPCNINKNKDYVIPEGAMLKLLSHWAHHA